MKIYNFAAIAAFAGLALTSCSSDDMPVISNDGHSARMTVNIGYADLAGETRTILTPDGRDLNCTWEEGDQVLVVETATGKKLGHLTLADGAGTSNATFDGMLEGVTDGKQNYSFFYLGREMQKAADTDVNAPLEYSFAVQTGEFENLKDYDFLCNTTEVVVDEGHAYTEDMGLMRKISFAHFTMTFPEGVTRTNEEITITGSHLYNAVDLSFGGGNDFSLNKKAGAITVSEADMYIVIVPDLENKTDLNFSCTIGEQDYVATLGERQWCESEYVNLDAEHGVVVAGQENRVYKYSVNYNWINPETRDTMSILDVIENQPAVFQFTIGTGFGSLKGQVAYQYEDYDFLGWYDNRDFNGDNLNGTTTVANKNNNTFMFYGKYEHKTYTFTLIADDCKGKQQINNMYVKDNKCVFDTGDFDVPVREGYIFKGWSLTKDGNTAVTTVEVTKADNFTKTVYAIWEKKQIGGGTPDASGKDY